MKIDELNRKWKTKLELDWWDGPHLAYNTYITQFQGEPMNKMVLTHFIRFVIKDWKIEAFHSYYDGNNCVWQFGPFVYGRAGYSGECKKCREEHET